MSVNNFRKLLYQTTQCKFIIYHKKKTQIDMDILGK